MNKEQEEAIKVCEEKTLNYELNKKMNLENKMTEQAIKESKAAETVLNLIKDKEAELEKKDKIIDSTLDLIFEYGGIDGEHHKKWLIDQIVRNLTGDDYKKWIKKYKNGEDGANTYEWDIGTAP